MYNGDHLKLWVKIVLGVAALLLLGAAASYAQNRRHGSQATISWGSILSFATSVFGGSNRSPDGTNGTACTQEAMQCPDGSWVGRSGPRCEFVCPTTGTGSSAAGGAGSSGQSATSSGQGTGRAGQSAGSLGQTGSSTQGTSSSGRGVAPYNSGIRGTVTVGPTCPAERTPPEPQCADKPLAVSVSFYKNNSNTLFAATQSDSRGIFEIALPPGTYTLKAGGTTPPTCPTMSLNVEAGVYLPVNVGCDSAVR